MLLTELQVRKFRNIVDSTPIEISEGVTCLVGKNESGKSALLQALYLLKPAYGDVFNLDEHYPRWLKIRDVKSGEAESVHPIRAVFRLVDADKSAVDASVGEGVLISDSFSLSLKYDGNATADCRLDEARFVQNLLNNLDLSSAVRKTLDGCKTIVSLKEAVIKLRDNTSSDDPDKRSELDSVHGELTSTLGSSTLWHHVVGILRARIPTFFLFSEYNLLEGRLDLQRLVPNGSEKPGASSLQTARALVELAGTNVASLGNEDYEIRKGELEAVSNELTSQVFEYWSQNQDLRVEIDVDKETVPGPRGQSAVSRYLDIRVRDQRHGYTNNFGQRSSGFQWFFSFLAAFSEFENSGTDIIVLLDEPALALHGKAQADFLRFINERLAPRLQVMYTTHSPFMVEMGHLERVRIVEDNGPTLGAQVTSDVFTMDRDSIFPLQAALGYDIAQSLFVGPDNLVVEGTSDFTYLTVISEFLASLKRNSLDPRWRILPAGGSSNIPTFVALIGPHLDVTVVVDAGTEGMQRITNMAKRGLLQGQRLITISEITETNHSDIEDLFAPADYIRLFNAAMKKRVNPAKLPPGDRIVKRIAVQIGGDFDHGLPADHLLRNRDTICPVLSEETLKRFEMLIERINQTLT